jgi:hypothetical protein
MSTLAQEKKQPGFASYLTDPILAGQQRTIERFFGTLVIGTLMQRLAGSVTVEELCSLESRHRNESCRDCERELLFQRVDPIEEFYSQRLK